jgi:hypothetical protein
MLPINPGAFTAPPLLSIQVFEFMDKEGCGTLDMASVAEEPPECLEELDDDVRTLCESPLEKRSRSGPLDGI